MTRTGLMKTILCIAIVTVGALTTPTPRAKVRTAKDQEQNKSVQDLTQWPMECEGAAARLDFAVIDTKKIEGGYLIVVARLGDGELSTRLNQTRLTVIKEYILRRGSDLKYVLAQGARVKGLGRVEVYVGGRLKEIMPYKKNAKTHCIQAEGW